MNEKLSRLRDLSRKSMKARRVRIRFTEYVLEKIDVNRVDNMKYYCLYFFIIGDILCYVKQNLYRFHVSDSLYISNSSYNLLTPVGYALIYFNAYTRSQTNAHT